MEPTLAPSADLLDAVRAGDSARVESLMASNPDLAYSRSPEGLSPLLLAMYTGRSGIAQLILSHGIIPDLFEACAAGVSQRVLELLDADPAQVNATSTDGFHPLGLACFFGHREVVTLLLDRGADVNAASVNSMQVQPIHSASARKDAEVLRLLLRAGANPNARQQMGFTPLHAAAQNGSSDMVEMLLEAGAEGTARSDDGRTAAQFAEERGHTGLAALLRQAL